MLARELSISRLGPFRSAKGCKMSGGRFQQFRGESLD
jgi:hypothetical protein